MASAPTATGAGAYRRDALGRQPFIYPSTWPTQAYSTRIRARGTFRGGYLRPYLNKVWIAEFDGYSSVDQFAFDVRPELAVTEFIAAFMRSEKGLEIEEALRTLRGVLSSDS